MAVVLTAEELSDYLKLADSTIYRLASRGELPGFRMGDSWQFDMDEILELIHEIKRRDNQDKPGLLEERI
jgi:excisionase family DNA binding protein